MGFKLGFPDATDGPSVDGPIGVGLKVGLSNAAGWEATTVREDVGLMLASVTGAIFWLEVTVGGCGRIWEGGRVMLPTFS